MSTASILNDVIGPVMRGPSSSHTAGAYRIATLARDLAGGGLRRVRCSFDPTGSYAPTYRVCNVDLAFAAGCLGWDLTDPRFADALEVCAAAGIELSFAVTSLAAADHPNTIRVELRMVDGADLVLWARSVGGGIVEIVRLDDWPVEMGGRSWHLLAEISTSQADAVLADIASALAQPPDQRRQQGGRTLLQWNPVTAPPPELLSRLRRHGPTCRVRSAAPVLLPQTGPGAVSSAAELLALASRDGVGLGDAALACEVALLGQPKEPIRAEMRRRYAVMRDSVAAGLDPRQVSMPLTDASAGRIFEAQRSGRIRQGGRLTRAAARAMAVMHMCNSRGVVCAAPTGGSAGVIPGVLLTLEEDGVEAEHLERALFAAGGVGLIIAMRATFAAETAGCQVEIGAAGAMAAAAVVDAAGGSAQEAADAAAIALQNTMGSVCDPVGGGCEIPCHTRNAVAAANAFVCADLIMGGYPNPIPLDQTIDAAFAVGRALPAELRCTALGGLAVTPAAQALAHGHTKTNGAS